MKKITTFSLVALTSLFFAACSDQASEAKQPESSSSKPNATTVTVALEKNTQPLSFTDDDGNLTGYEYDLIQEINKVIEGYHIEIEAVSAEAAEVGIESGKYEIVGGGLFKTEARQEKYLFPDENTGVSTIEIYKKTKDKDLQTLEDLVGKNLSPVTANGGIFNLLTKYNEENSDKQITINLGESGELAERFQKLNDGDYDAVVLPSNFGAEEIIKQLDLDVDTADKPVQVNGTYFIIAKSEEDFKEAFDKAVSQLKEDGKLAQLSEKWFGQDMFQYELTEE